MNELIREIADLARPRVLSIIGDVHQKKDYKEGLNISQKSDNSIVTEVDLKISRLIDELLEGREDITLFCEENHDLFRYPMAILDPIDGTRGLANGTSECVVSLAIKGNSRINEGGAWIFNPFSGLDMISESNFVFPPNDHQGPLLGLVSRSEWERGLFKGLEFGKIGNQNYSLYPKGSIAFKLGLLSTGAADFVLSQNPKNIWDIAAGTILCEQRGIHLYNQIGKIEEFSEKVLDGPLLWCKENIYSAIHSQSPLFVKK